MSLRYWRIRIGIPEDPDLYVPVARRRGYIAIGWSDLGDLSRFKNEDELKRKYKEVYGGDITPAELRTLWDFSKEIKIGDIVLLPHIKEGVIYVGRVSGPYTHREDWEDSCEFPNRMRVEWFKELRRDDLPEGLRKVLETPSTLVNLDKYASDIEFCIISKGYKQL